MSSGARAPQSLQGCEDSCSLCSSVQQVRWTPLQGCTPKESPGHHPMDTCPTPLPSAEVPLRAACLEFAPQMHPHPSLSWEACRSDGLWLALQTQCPLQVPGTPPGPTVVPRPPSLHIGHGVRGEPQLERSPFCFLSKLKCPLERMMVPGVCRREDAAARIFDVQLAFLVHVTPSHIITTQQGEPHCCPTRWPLAIGATSILMKENRIKLNIGFLTGYILSAGHYK